MGRRGRGVLGTGWGQRKRHRTPLLGSLPPARSGRCAPTRRSRRRRRMNKMAAATSQAGNRAGRRRGPPGHRSGQPRRPARGDLRGQKAKPKRKPCARSRRTTSSPWASWPAAAQPAVGEIGQKETRCGVSRNSGLEKQRRKHFSSGLLGTVV